MTTKKGERERERKREREREREREINTLIVPFNCRSEYVHVHNVTQSRENAS